MSGLLDLLKRARPRKKETHKEIEITPEIADQLEQLGLSQLTTPYIYEIAARILQTYPDDGFETLSLISEKSLKYNHGLPYAMIERHGTQRVREILDKYGRDSSVYIDDIFFAIAKTSEDTVNEISNKFGLKNVSIIAPRYAEYGEELTKKILDEWDDERYLLSKVFPIYRELQEAYEKSSGEETKQYEITFEGRVQDVGFRYTSKGYAEICGLTGTVKNQYDGSVLCQVQGPDTLVDLFIFRLSQVFNVQGSKKGTELRYSFSDFQIIR